MRKHRFFYAHALEINANVELDADTSHYIARVLRLKNSDTIYLFNNSGFEYCASITQINKRNVMVAITTSTRDKNESPLKIHLAQVIGKGEKMDLVIQKTTELGVCSITPLYSEHTIVKNIPERNSNKIEHWQKIAAAACAQSGRNMVPVINVPISLSNWLLQQECKHKLILSPDDKAQHVKNLNINDEVTVLIGPEGGFSATEIQLAVQHNFNLISLGPRILRTETAGFTAVAILQAIFGDL
jgi:16S rRNA (uracil1498-N3)-methyltransferase